MWDFPLFPEQASSFAGAVDLLFSALTALSLLVSIPIVFLIFYFAIKYRRGSNADRSNPPGTDVRLEVIWILFPFLLGIGIFVWAAFLYFHIMRPPDHTLDIYVIGRQWMWQIQHPEGQREINEIHVPTGRPVKLIMTSQDVIHSFYVPAFRVKMDVLPGRFTTAWFEATRAGEYRLFCTEYCGTEHADMMGRVIAMEPAQYQEWLSGRATGALTEFGEPLTAAGAQLFERLGCDSCHQPDGSGRGPSLLGLFGSQVQLESGEVVTADEDYLRESILQPQAKIVAGFEPIMPSYEGQVSEEQLQQLVAYIKSLDGEAQDEGDQEPRE